MAHVDLFGIDESLTHPQIDSSFPVASIGKLCGLQFALAKLFRLMSTSLRSGIPPPRNTFLVCIAAQLAYARFGLTSWP